MLSSLAAFYKGSTDVVLTNLSDIFLLMPAPMMMIVIGASFRDLTPAQLGLIYGVIAGAGTTMIVLRSHALKIVAQPYMEAARVAGGGGMHMIFKHLIPNMASLAALQMMIVVTGVVVADGFISFFGFSRVANNWGTMIYDAFVYANVLKTGTQWNALLPPAIAFTLFAMGFYLISRGLQWVVDPKMRDPKFQTQNIRNK